MTESERPWRVAAASLLVFGLALLLWWLELRSSFHGLQYPDALDYAQLGRELHETGRMRSRQCFPYVLGWLEERQLDTRPPWPDLARFPLPVLSRAASFALFGTSDLAAVLPGAAFLSLSSVLVFLLGRRLFGTPAGLVGALLYAAAPSSLHNATSGTTEAGAAFFVALVALLLSLNGGRRKTWIPAVLLGLAIGLAALQRSNLALAAPIAALLLWLGPERRGWRVAACVLVACLLALLPWWLANASAFGEPFVNLTADRGLVLAVTGSDPFFSFAQHDTWRLATSDLGAFTRALRPAWVVEHATEIFGAGFAWLAPLFLLAGLGRCTAAVRAAWLFALAGLLLTYLLLAGIYPEVMRFYHPWVPPCLVLAVGGVSRLLRRLPGRLQRFEPLAVLLVLLLVLVPVARQAARGARPLSAVEIEIEEGLRELALAVDAQLAPEAVVAADCSVQLAWRSGRPSVRFRGSLAQLERLERDFFPVAAVVLRGRAARRFGQALAEREAGAGARATLSFPNDVTMWLRGDGW